jgi:hypothetical protein
MNTTIINLKRQKTLAEHPAGMFWLTAPASYVPNKKESPPHPQILRHGGVDFLNASLASMLPSTPPLKVTTSQIKTSDSWRKNFDSKRLHDITMIERKSVKAD